MQQHAKIIKSGLENTPPRGKTQNFQKQQPLAKHSVFPLNTYKTNPNNNEKQSDYDEDITTDNALLMMSQNL